MAAGCSIIIKCPEETPGSPIEFVKCFHDAGVPPGVINLVYGVPAEISEYLIPNPVIRKISFTGSVPVGKKLNALAALHMKRATMELGGHAPVLIFDDVETDQVAALLHGMKTRNAGQVCVSPTRFFVHEKAYDKFVGKFTDLMKATTVGEGLDPASKMGPLANPRRVNAMETLVNDALEKGAKSSTGGKRIGNAGQLLRADRADRHAENARIMTEEPFGPVALMMRFKDTDTMLTEANAAVRLGLLRLHQGRQDGRQGRRRPRRRHGLDQPLRHRAPRNAVRRHQGLQASATKAASKGCRRICSEVCQPFGVMAVWGQTHGSGSLGAGHFE